MSSYTLNPKSQPWVYSHFKHILWGLYSRGLTLGGKFVLVIQGAYIRDFTALINFYDMDIAIHIVIFIALNFATIHIIYCFQTI